VIKMLSTDRGMPGGATCSLCDSSGPDTMLFGVRSLHIDYGPVRLSVSICRTMRAA
jgi:hypothetical protein